jgi:hypothetical protein
MGLVAGKQQTKQFVEQQNITPGNYPARLVQLIDLGLQAQNPYMGKEKPPVQQIMLTYELVDEFMKDEDGNDIEDKPRWVSEILPFFGLHADKAKSTQRYNAFDPQGVHSGDFSQAIGLPINVTIVNNPSSNGKIYDNVAGISPMRPRDAQACPELKNVSKVFDLDNPDMETFSALPEWIQKKIVANLNYAGSPLEKALAGKPVGQKEADKPKAAPKAKAAAKVVEEDDDQTPY